MPQSLFLFDSWQFDLYSYRVCRFARNTTSKVCVVLHYFYNLCFNAKENTFKIENIKWKVLHSDQLKVDKHHICKDVGRK